MPQSRPLFREGFLVRENNFVLPEQTVGLDPGTKRDLTICNLFINHQLSIPNIKDLLDEDFARIVDVLIGQGILQDRRQMNGRPPGGVNRRIVPRKVEELKKSRWSQKST